MTKLERANANLQLNIFQLNLIIFSSGCCEIRGKTTTTTMPSSDGVSVRVHATTDELLFVDVHSLLQQLLLLLLLPSRVKCTYGKMRHRSVKNGDRGLHSKPVLPLFAPPGGEVNKNMFDFLTNRSNQHIWSHSSSCSQACWNATNVAEIRLWNKCTSLPHESGKSNFLSPAWAKQTRHVFTIRPSLDGNTLYESLAAGKWHQETRGNKTG